MKKKLILAAFVLQGIFIFAQSNDLLDKLLAEEKASFGYSAYLVLSAAGHIPPEASVQQALAYLEKTDWGIYKKTEDPTSLGELCYLFMRSFNLSGGLMYSLFPSPRYATRELEFKGLLVYYPIPTRLISGQEVMQLTSRLLEWLKVVPK